MSMNETPSANRVHIGFFGRRNAGKSSLVNAFTGQKMSVVSDFGGTTTDTVKKAMELLPMGSVVIIDTPGFDDEGELGKMRVAAAKKALESIDAAVLVCDGTKGIGKCEKQLIKIFDEHNTPYIIAYNKCDLDCNPQLNEKSIAVSAITGENITELKERVARLIPSRGNKLGIVSGIVKRGDFAVLVTPIDSAAPKGRMILPQQQVIRDVLDCGAANIVVKEDMLKTVLESMSVKPAVVITDSQVFGAVSKITPKNIKLTSFSILMANFKGMLETAVHGAAAMDRLKNGDRVLIAEGCTHHRQCDDIGSVKIPKWLREYTGCELDLTIVPGHEFPEKLDGYSLVIHCGGCMLTEKEILVRMEKARKSGVPFTNYGIAIAQMHGILRRSLEVFPDILKILE